MVQRWTGWRKRKTSLKILWCLHFIYRWETGAPLLGSSAWTHSGGHWTPSSCQWAVLGRLSASGSLISCLDPRLPTLNPSLLFSWNTKVWPHEKTRWSFMRRSMPFPAFRDLQGCPQLNHGNQRWNTGTFWARCTYTRWLLCSVPSWHCWEDCAVVTQTEGAAGIPHCTAAHRQIKTSRSPNWTEKK